MIKIEEKNHPRVKVWVIFFNPNLRRKSIIKRGWDKSPSLSIVFGLSSKTQWLSGLYYADFISFYSPTQLCGGGTTKSNSNELPISVPLSFTIQIPSGQDQRESFLFTNFLVKFVESTFINKVSRKSTYTSNEKINHTSNQGGESHSR